MGTIHSLHGRARHLIGRLARERKGAALPIMAAALIPVLGGIGTAVDVGRIYLVHHQLQSGVDAAALAGARAFGNETRADEGRDRQVAIYFDENFPAGFLGTPTVIAQPTFQTEAGVNVTTVNARLDLPFTFMRLFGFSTHTIQVTARAELQPRPIEVMVVLDDTGSMQTKDVEPTGSVQRMAALKTAMHDFVAVLHQGATRRAELAMGFVTYNVTTNVGEILRRAGVEFQVLDGFNDDATTPYPLNPLGWRGCVENDQSLVGVNLSATPTTFEDGAWDIMGSLPGETVNGIKHPPLKPYLYPPNAGATGAYKTTQTTAASYNPTYTQSNTADNRTNNFYRLGPKNDLTIGQAMANRSAYRQFFYDYYIGLNATNSDPTDDVIVSNDDTYYAPGSGPNWKVNYARVPGIGDDTKFAAANGNFGFPLDSRRAVDYPRSTNGRVGANLRMPSPNFQCPEPAMDVQYGRERQVYDDYIESENFPIMPASGTLHHIGMLWGYRLLTRSNRFTRENPIPDQIPLRALVFMTDGQTATSDSASWYGAYGNPRERRISASATADALKGAIMRRFAKVCEKAKQDGVVVYIVSLISREPEFQTCAGTRYWHTTDRDTIKAAFNEIAVDLVDLHLTR